jgi:hypothetical protein
MFDVEQLPALREMIRARAGQDRAILDRLIDQVRRARKEVRTIRPRSATSVAVMAADGGNNNIAFNPFSLQIVRIVDSRGKELALDVVSPTTDIDALSRNQISGNRPTALGRLMQDLEVGHLRQLSSMMSGASASWVQVYRDLCEWATLYELVCYKDFAQDTLVVRDGLLRSKLFAKDYFIQMYELMTKAIDRCWREDRRRIWLVGLAKKTKVLDHYRLAISLARIFEVGSPCFVPVPREMQDEAYNWEEYVRRPDEPGPGGEVPKFNIGTMHFVRFGPRSGDPIWTVDLLDAQRSDSATIFGYLLADAVAGFPIPFYPNCLQQADNHSRVAELDLDIVENMLVDAVREQVGPDLAPVIDELQLAVDVAARRYE